MSAQKQYITDQHGKTLTVIVPISEYEKLIGGQRQTDTDDDIIERAEASLSDIEQGNTKSIESFKADVERRMNNRSI